VIAVRLDQLEFLVNLVTQVTLVFPVSLVTQVKQELLVSLVTPATQETQDQLALKDLQVLLALT
jgi:hypothetical protein